MNEIDLIVSGGGTAGMAAAIHAAGQGFRVVVFDASGPDYDKPCGEGLMPKAKAYLNDLGVRLDVTHALSGIQYVFPDRRLEAKFSEAAGIGVRRTVLRKALWKRALDLGVEIRNESVKSLKDQHSYVQVNDLRGRYCIVAEGIHSQSVKNLGLKKRRAKHSRFGVRTHLPVKPWSDFVEVWWGKDFEIYITPVASDVINIALLANRAMTLEDALKDLPALAEKIDLTNALTKRAGAGPLLHRTTRRRVGRILIAGDAAGFVDAMTGEGNTLALGSGIAAVQAIVSGDLESYGVAWWRVVWRYWLLTRIAAALAVRPFWRILSLSMIKRAPWLMRKGLLFLCS